MLQNESFLSQIDEQEFIFEFLCEVVAATPSFDFVLEFFTVKEKLLVKEVVEGLRLLEEDKKERMLKCYLV